MTVARWRIAERLLKHSFEVAAAVIFILLAVGVEVSGHHLGASRIQMLPVLLVVTWEAGLFFGAAGMLVGLLWPWSATTGYAVERAGLITTAGVWATYVLVLASTRDLGQMMSMALSTTIVAGCVGRIVYTLGTERGAERAADEPPAGSRDDR